MNGDERGSEFCGGWLIGVMAQSVAPGSAFICGENFLLAEVRRILCRIPGWRAAPGCWSFATMDDHVTFSEYAPPAGRGPVVIVLSGTSGPGHSLFIARELAAQGYYAVLHDAKDFQPWVAYSRENLRQVVF
jgi:hypothetical protein